MEFYEMELMIGRKYFSCENKFDFKLAKQCAVSEAFGPYYNPDTKRLISRKKCSTTTSYYTTDII